MFLKNLIFFKNHPPLDINNSETYAYGLHNYVINRQNISHRNFVRNVIDLDSQRLDSAQSLSQTDATLRSFFDLDNFTFSSLMRNVDITYSLNGLWNNIQNIYSNTNYQQFASMYDKLLHYLQQIYLRFDEIRRHEQLQELRELFQPINNIYIQTSHSWSWMHTLTMCAAFALGLGIIWLVARDAAHEVRGAIVEGADRATIFKDNTMTEGKQIIAETLDNTIETIFDKAGKKLWFLAFLNAFLAQNRFIFYFFKHWRKK